MHLKAMWKIVSLGSMLKPWKMVIQMVIQVEEKGMRMEKVMKHGQLVMMGSIDVVVRVADGEEEDEGDVQHWQVTMTQSHSILINCHQTRSIPFAVVAADAPH
jgi:hypothetical protein